MLDGYEGDAEHRAWCVRWLPCWASPAFSCSAWSLYPMIGKSYFPRTDPSQFVISLKAPSGTRLELTDQMVGQVEDIVRDVVSHRTI